MASNMKKEDRVEGALRRGIKNGLHDAGDYLIRFGRRHAKDKILSADKVWRKNLKRGFWIEPDQTAKGLQWSGTIANKAPHAEIVEKGLAPAGEITGSTPSVQDIIPWVDSEITPNQAARDSAEKANIGNWDVQLQALAVQYGKATVIAAFAIARHIKDEGYSGIYFMERTEGEMRSEKYNVKKKVEKEMRKELRKSGLK